MTDNARAAAPITASRFSITIDGVQIAVFSELSGIRTEIEPVELKDPGGEKVPRRIPPAVTLKRGMNQDMGMNAWHEAVLTGQMAQARKSCSLVMYSTSGAPVARFFLKNAWPSKIEISGLKAGSNEVLMETVTLVCDELQRIAP